MTMDDLEEDMTIDDSRKSIGIIQMLLEGVHGIESRRVCVELFER